MIHKESPIDHLRRNINTIKDMYGAEGVVWAILRALNDIQQDPEYLEWYCDDHEGLPSAGNDSGMHTMIWGALARCLIPAERKYNERKKEG